MRGQYERDQMMLEQYDRRVKTSSQIGKPVIISIRRRKSPVELC
ncbi:hypothetical protein VP01_2095g2 [Puccinia sorghi]|uniref:Uncharacterized protein n=1 Tax=Puccinia sorghi TaxID=27349 RepID=A0A0L6VAV4_9BASI|nr:hypothetical protein VP01_2095g2 [Puccinia sorghi]